MPMNAKGQEIMSSFMSRYGKKKGKRVKVGHHAMLVCLVSGKTMTTWEGNSNDKVATRVRDVADCIGFVRPIA